MNITGPLVDGFGRTHTDLRVSVTDRCNIRCFYCMPAHGVQFRPHAAILSFEEIQRFVRVAARLGVREVRLTGGEPLVRKGVCTLVRMLVAIPGIDDLSMTTNAILLGKCAADLRAAGLDRLNISLDTLDPQRFRQIARSDELPRALEGIAAAVEAGFRQIKINALAIRGQTEEEIVPLAEFACRHGLELRFIEFMPLDGDVRWDTSQVLSGPEILDRLTEALGPMEPMDTGSHAPATRYRFVGREAPPIGIVASVSSPFCDRCSRLRLTSEGKIRNCLFGREEFDARALLRDRADDQELAALIVKAVQAKKRAHGTDNGEFARPQQSMHQIGG